MKSSNCDTWIDEEAEVHAPTLDTCTNAGGGDGNSGEGGLPLKKPKGSAWDRVLGSVLVMFIGSGFRRDANFVNIGFVHLDLSNGDLKYGTEFDTAPFYNNTTKCIHKNKHIICYLLLLFFFHSG